MEASQRRLNGTRGADRNHCEHESSGRGWNKLIGLIPLTELTVYKD